MAESTIAENLEKLKTLLESYDAISTDVAALKTLVLEIVDAHIINNASYAGITFTEGYTPKSCIDVWGNRAKIERIEDDTIEAFGENYALRDLTSLTYASLNALKGTADSTRYCFYNCTSLKEFHAPNATNWATRNSFSGCIALEKIYFDKLETTNGVYDFQGLTNLKYIYMPNVYRFLIDKTYGSFSGCVNLIDIETGGKFDRNEFFPSWNPTNALMDNSSSLVEEGETFANNLEKLLYNIREHFAANLPTITTTHTIMFSSAVYNAISADTATLQAFTDKNWTIASA